MSGEVESYKRTAIAGSGAIACGLAATVSRTAEATLLARSDDSAARAERSTTKLCEKLEDAEASRLRITTDEGEVADSDLIVESVVEDPEVKASVLGRLGEVASGADLATTTSSLSISGLGESSGHPDRVFGLHVFNPVPKMELIEICFPNGAPDGMRERALAWCEEIGKTAVEVPDQAGFVVNRLLFPFLFDAVRLMESTGMEPAAIDTCMSLGAGHPMGPLALLDLVGLDVAQAIGEAQLAESGNPSHRPPDSLVAKVEAGELGRKAGAGFHRYD